MKLEFVCRNSECSEHLKSVTEQKLSKLDKYFDGNDTEARVYFKKEKDRFTTEVMLTYAGKFVRASSTGENFYNELDDVLPRLEGQIRKYRTLFDKNRKNSAFKMQSEFAGAEKEESAKSDIVKKKQFELKPLTVQEAITEMELLGHSFFVFKEAKTGEIQVLYKRNDGDLGLIEPVK